MNPRTALRLWVHRGGGCRGGESTPLCTPVHENAGVWYTQTKRPGMKPGPAQAHLCRNPFYMLLSCVTSHYVNKPLG